MKRLVRWGFRRFAWVSDFQWWLLKLSLRWYVTEHLRFSYDADKWQSIYVGVDLRRSRSQLRGDQRQRRAASRIHTVTFDGPELDYVLTALSFQLDHDDNSSESFKAAGENAFRKLQGLLKP